MIWLNLIIGVVCFSAGWAYSCLFSVAPMIAKLDETYAKGLKDGQELERKLPAWAIKADIVKNSTLNDVLVASIGDALDQFYQMKKMFRDDAEFMAALQGLEHCQEALNCEESPDA